jgi:DNA-binding transcriptional MocR family regulator
MKIEFAQRVAGVEPNAVGELLRLGAEPGIISFAGGYPDASLFPRAELDAVLHEAVMQQGATSLQYTVSDGLPKLRAQIAARLSGLGTPCTADDVLVLQGSQQGLDLVGKMLINPGDAVITESPTFVGALIAFAPCEPSYRGVPTDADGMDMERLEQALKQSPRARLIYTIPDFQNPKGVSMSAARRKRLVALANQYDAIVLEDTAYAPLRFAGETPPSIRSLDTEGRVIQLGSFSKILAPGLRLGWAVASPPLLQKLGLLKLAADTQCNTLSMVATSLYLERHDIEAHIRTLRQTYLRKKNLMLDMIRQHFPQEVSMTDPEGGLFTWVTFPASVDTGRFMREQALPKAHVAYVPGQSFFPTDPERNHARFNFSGQPDELIEKGMRALGRVLKDEMKGR